ncbi:MAG TPA: histidine utilization repressor [Steroidobacteraceae bacterium]|nr:histidine utilization repressor [Steroidobacteraceae bacterium]
MVGVHAPLYERIKELILSRIANGDWAPAQRVPSENELVRRVGASRMTVNRALRELTAAGYLVRLQGVGTFVADRRAQGHPLAIRNIADEIVARGHLHSARVLTLERCTASSRLAAHFNLRAGHELFHSRVVHLENGLPLQLEDRYVNPAVAPDYLDQDFAVTTPNAYLMRVAPLSSVEHIVQAARTDPGTAQLLQMDASEPCLVLRRRTWSRGAVASAVTLSHPASRFELQGQFTP